MEKITPRNLDLDESVERINKFLDLVEKDAVRREKANDNVNSKLTIDSIIRCAVESIGTISSADSKNRYELIKAECIDLVYCAILLYLKSNKLTIDNG